MSRFMWLYVTSDEYEFPIEWAYTAKALADRIGVTEGTIRACVHDSEAGIIKKSKYARVEIDDDDE